MASFAKGWRIQVRVISALMIRELTTRFGRENIGFLWVMVEPLLFAILVGIIWTYVKGTSEHGIGIMAFIATGYIPLVLFRQGVNRSALLFSVNGSLMYHRQIKVVDFVFVRFFIEFIGAMMAYLFVAIILIILGLFPIPYHIGFVVMGMAYYGLFTLSLCFILAPLSEMSEAVEKFLPVTTYVMIPFSGTFNLVEWLAPGMQQFTLYSPPVHAMEMMRYGVFGEKITPYFSYIYPLEVTAVLMMIGLSLCRYVRRNLVVE